MNEETSVLPNWLRTRPTPMSEDTVEVIDKAIAKVTSIIPDDVFTKVDSFIEKMALSLDKLSK